MFGGWAHLASIPEDLTEKERTPPPAPTKLDFPRYNPQYRSEGLTSVSSQHLCKLLCSLKKPQDITPDCVQALNLSVILNVRFEDHLSVSTNPNHHDPKQSPSQDRLDQTVQELRTPTSAAFREVIRLPPLPGHPRVRLIHTRKFWTGLQKMSQYWDCSMDQFYDVPDTDDESSSSSNSDRDSRMVDPDPPQLSLINVPSTTTKQVYKGRRIGAGSGMPLAHRDETVAGLIETVVWAYNCQVRAPNLPPRLTVQNLLFPVRQSFIVGRLPKERDIARKGVLDGPVLGVCCRGETDFGNNSEGEGVVTAGKENWRETLDLIREAAVLLLLAQERAREGKSEIKPGEGKWWTSMPRWGGRPGGAMENGSLAGAVIGEDRLSNTTPADAAETPMTDEQDTRHGNDMKRSGLEEMNYNPAKGKRKADGRDVGSRRSRDNVGGVDGMQHKRGNTKPTPADKWRTLKPGPGIWDQKIRYMRIGAPSPSPPAPVPPPSSNASPGPAPTQPDRVFLISSLNHHIALLSMDVSARYLDWLAGDEQQTGQHNQIETKPSSQSPSPSPSPLQLRRTRWFDLFEEADRVEFVQGLWQVMGWLMRGEGRD